MAAYLTPGIYRRPRPSQRKDVRLVRTDVAGFVGFAERGPLPNPDRPAVDPKTLAVRLTSWKEFTSVFGTFIPYGTLAYAVRAFFENGGTTCYAVRVAATHATDRNARPRRASIAVPNEAGAVIAATLAAPIGEGRTDLTLDDARGLAEGDLVVVGREGLFEFATVVAVLDPTTVRLGTKTGTAHLAGEAVFRYAPALTIEALSEGNWGNRLKVTITPLEAGSSVDEFSLRVSLEPGVDPSAPRLEELYRRVSLKPTLDTLDDPPHPPNPSFLPTVVNAVSQLIRVIAPEKPTRVRIGDPEGSVLDRGPVGLGAFYLSGGRDGLSAVGARDFTGGLDDFRGIRLLEEIDEVAILCAPDAVLQSPPVLPARPQPPHHPCEAPPPPPAPDPIADDVTAVPPAFDDVDVLDVYAVLVDQCERLRDRVAVLDTPFERRTPSLVVGWRNLISTRFAALYYPWLKVPDALDRQGRPRALPPSAHVAGVYARIDNQYGVQRPPANAELQFVVDVADDVAAEQQDQLNPYDVNAIRAFQGRGVRVWGARSLAPRGDEDWRFIHTRRLMSMIEESVDKSMQWAVFESNDFALRRTLVHSLSVFLEAIWRQGGLKGALPAQAFYVKCDDTNNPPSVVDAGQIVCEVGVAVAAPMEFIVFDIHQGPSGGEIVEH